MSNIPPPEYSEKTAESSESFRPIPTTLTQSFSTARTNRIEETIVTSIYPHLESAAHRGIARITLVLLPTDLTASLEIDSKEAANAASVIGFPSDEFVQLIYLPQAAGTLEFWRQANIIPDLISRIKSILAASGSKVRSDVLPSPSVQRVPPSSSPPPPPPLSRGFFKRSWSRQIPLPEVEGVDAEISSTPVRLAPGEVEITGAVQDISFRIITEMGLYDTRAEKGVVVKMEIGA